MKRLEDYTGDNIVLQVERDCYQRKLDRDPSDPAAHFGKAIMCDDLGDYKIALFHYNAAIQLAPQNTKALIRRSKLLATCPIESLRNTTLALSDAKEAISIVRENGSFKTDWIARDYLIILQYIYGAMGDLENALLVQREIMQYANTRTSINSETSVLVNLEARCADTAVLPE